MSEPALHPVIYSAHAHLAGALVALKAAVDAHWPGRDTRSDGGIGDARHQAEISDHNPDPHTGAVRAFDFTASQPDKGIHGVDGAWLSEQLRMVGHAGDPRLTGGGYVIYNGHITSPDFSHWTPYGGPGKDPHVTHVHVSVTTNPQQYEYTGPWAFLATAPLPSPPIPVPAPAPAVEHIAPTGHDATGHGENFRADIGDQGPEVRELQHDLNRYAPAYSHLEEDGVYGEHTAAVVEEYAHREAREVDTPAADRAGLAGADGRNVGPRIAHALAHDGLI